MQHTSKQSTHSRTALAVCLATFACGDATGVDPEDLAGTWNAVSAIATNAADVSETVDILATGAAITLIVAPGGLIEIIFEVQDIVDRNSGTLTVTDGEFELLIEGRPSTGTISRLGETLTMDVITGVGWDFGNGGLDEPATLLMVLQRSPS